MYPYMSRFRSNINQFIIINKTIRTIFHSFIHLFSIFKTKNDNKTQHSKFNTMHIYLFEKIFYNKDTETTQRKS